MMGSFKRTNKTVRGYPTYKKTEGDVAYCLYREENGHWAVTDTEENMATNNACVVSKVPAELPTHKGLEWCFMDVMGNAWKDDSSITCTEVSRPGFSRRLR